jgi:hypothetical protein
MVRRPTRRLTTMAMLIALSMAVSPSAITPPRISFTETRLSNGLRLIVAEDHVAPVFSIAVVYNVGSRDERQGRTGFAHLFEHMMFKGSENVGTEQASVSDVHEWRQHERHHEQGPHTLLRDAAVQPRCDAADSRSQGSPPGVMRIRNLQIGAISSLNA